MLFYIIHTYFIIFYQYIETFHVSSIRFYEPNSKEAYELAAELWGIDLAEEGLVFDEKTRTYEYRDEPSEVPQIT